MGLLRCRRGCLKLFIVFLQAVLRIVQHQGLHKNMCNKDFYSRFTSLTMSFVAEQFYSVAVLFHPIWDHPAIYSFDSPLLEYSAADRAAPVRFPAGHNIFVHRRGPGYDLGQGHHICSQRWAGGGLTCSIPF
jgi:hypothetical protein